MLKDYLKMPLSGPFFSTYWFDRTYREYSIQKRRLVEYMEAFPRHQNFAQIKVSKLQDCNST